MLTYLRTAFGDILDLIYPRICAGCDYETPVRGGIFCIDCLAELPETNYHNVHDNPFERHFWGRVQIEAGAAFLYFVPGGRTQKLLHHIKYKGQADYAETIGNIYGKKLGETDRFSDLDCVVPVPLHWKREHKRGFNQSSAFGKGLSQSLDIPQYPKALRRVRGTSTQTRKSRADRIENMRDAFVVRNPDKLTGHHILLVDDVLTTGATLEACAHVLLQIPQVQVSLVTIACGRL